MCGGGGGNANLIAGAAGAAIGAAVASGAGSDEDETPPNVAGNMTDAEKAEIGGSGSGTPGGWEPQDEENARNNEQKTTVDDLMSSSSKGQETIGRSKLLKEQVAVMLLIKSSIY